MPYVHQIYGYGLYVCTQSAFFHGVISNFLEYNGSASGCFSLFYVGNGINCLRNFSLCLYKVLWLPGKPHYAVHHITLGAFDS